MADNAPTQRDIAEKALRMAGGTTPDARPDNDPTAGKGMRDVPREDYPPSGAFDAEGREPAMRRSRER